MNEPRDLIVVKLGGTTLAEEHETLADVARGADRYAIVLVHGGGKRLTDWMARLGLEARFEAGRRVTDDDALELALGVLGGIVNGELVAELLRLGVPAVGMTGIDGRLLDARRVPQLGRVAHVVGARPQVLYAPLAGGLVPVVAPLALDEDDVICNVNADEAAAGLAGALGATLILLTDTDGVQDAGGHRLDRLDELTAEQLISEGVISGGMIPKVQGAFAALRSGSPEVVIADGRRPGALLAALDEPAFGTRLAAAAE